MKLFVIICINPLCMQVLLKALGLVIVLPLKIKLFVLLINYRIKFLLNLKV